MKRVLQSVRLGVCVLLVCAGAAAAPAAATVDPSPDSFPTQIRATATGKTIPLGDGTFRMVGMYTESSGVIGTYEGTYVEDTTGYTTCPYIGFGQINCLPQCNDQNRPFCYEGFTAYRCNLVHGELTLRSQGRVLNLLISRGSFAPGERVLSSICLGRENPESHEVILHLFGSGEGFSTGYGDLGYAWGEIVGLGAPAAGELSTPLGRGGVYADSFVFGINLCPACV